MRTVFEWSVLKVLKHEDQSWVPALEAHNASGLQPRLIQFGWHPVNRFQGFKTSRKTLEQPGIPRLSQNNENKRVWRWNRAFGKSHYAFLCDPGGHRADGRWRASRLGQGSPNPKKGAMSLSLKKRGGGSGGGRFLRGAISVLYKEPLANTISLCLVRMCERRVSILL